MARIFLSHSSADSRQAIALKTWLAEQDPPLANEIFLDLDVTTGIAVGRRWKHELVTKNTACEAVICLLSKAWESSRECTTEYRLAESLSKQIFCARLEPYTGGGITDEWQRCDLFGAEETVAVDIGKGPPVVFALEGLLRLRDGIRGTGIGAEFFIWPPPDDLDRSPYRGWDPMEEEDAGVFFGRDAEIVLALDALRGMRQSEIKSLFVVLGPSGSGKSSFLRAGLWPRLRREYRRYVVLDIMRPQREPLSGKTGLAQVIHRGRTALGLTQPPLGTIRNACLGGNVRAIRTLLAECQAAASELPGRDPKSPLPTIMLAIDQAEELFSVDAGAEAKAFLRLIAGLVKPSVDGGALVVAASIRTDRYEVMQTAPELSGVQSELFEALKPMPRDQFKEVITAPAARFSAQVRRVTIAPALVNRLLADATGGDALPLLALTLARLFEDYGTEPELTPAHYAEMQGMRRVVQTQIDKVLSADPAIRADQLRTLRSAFIPWLATINPKNDQPLRRIARWDDLPPASHPLIEAFVDKRLLVTDLRNDGTTEAVDHAEDSQETVVEVALESLLRQWDDLAEWLREERGNLRTVDDVEHQAASWQDSGRSEAWLMEGERLTRAEQLLSSVDFGPLLTPAADFLAASRRREDQRTAREQHQQEVELQAARAHALTREATALRLTSEALAMLSGAQPGGDVRAFHQLLAANSLAPGQVEAALRGALTSRPGLQKIVATQSAVRSVMFSPDGRLLLSGEDAGSIRRWQVNSGLEFGEALVGHRDSIYAVVCSRDGRLIVSGSYDRTIRVWDAATGRQIGPPLIGHLGRVFSVSISADGSRIASGGADTTVRLWDGRGPIGGPLVGHTGWVRSVDISPDGRWVASASDDRTVRLWDVEAAGPLRAPLTGHRDCVYGVAFSHDGRLLASGSADAGVRLWDAATGTPLGEPLVGESGAVFSVAFNHDGTRLVTGCADGAVEWDVETRRQIGSPLAGSLGWVWSADCGVHGTIATGSADATIRLWTSQDDVGDAAAGADVAAALRAKLTANMTKKQWSEWVSPALDYIKSCPELPVPDVVAAEG